jgi:ketosteroid isomerase-like protein
MADREGMEALIRGAFDAFNRGDIDAVIGRLDPEIDVSVAPGLAHAGVWHGTDGFLEMLESWSEPFESLRNELLSLEFVDSEHVIAAMRQTAVGAGSGVPVEMDIFYLFGVRDLRLTRFHVCADRAAALAAIEDSRE